jgi:hypothetical protein
MRGKITQRRLWDLTVSSPSYEKRLFSPLNEATAKQIPVTNANL